MGSQLQRLLGIDVARRLREVRLIQGLTQDDVAALSGIGRETIASFEHGSRIDAIKLVHLLKILRAYGITPTTFFSWKPERPQRKR
jgi:transcriptional regulator with XRE-family HTH domain